MLELLQSRTDIVQRIPNYTYRKSGNVEQFKAMAELVDGSRLHINEVWVNGDLRKYAYYHVTPTGEVIQGWDNAPHHSEVETYPHHWHKQDMVIASSVRGLIDALNMLV